MRNLFFVYFLNLYMFRAYLVPSSWGTTVCIQQQTTSVVVVGLKSNPTRTTDSHLKIIISTNCCIHTVLPPDDGPRYARNTYRLTKYTKNKLEWNLDWNSNPTRTVDSHLKRIISSNFCIHTVAPPDDGPRYARNMNRLTKYAKNKLCIKFFFLHKLCSTLSSWDCVSGENYEISKSGVGHVVNPELTDYIQGRHLFESDVSPTGSTQAWIQTSMCFIE